MIVRDLRKLHEIKRATAAAFTGGSMEREAECTFRRDRNDPMVKAILESGELILRGGIRRNIPIGSMHDLHVKGGDLCFTVGDESFFLALGSAEAAHWAEIIAATRAAFAKRFDTPSQPSVRMLDPANEDAIRAVLEDAAQVSATEGDLIMVRVETPDALITTLEHAVKGLAKGKPIWFIYCVGSGHSLRRSSVDGPVRTSGRTNTKVTAISPR
jgi:hypothetical protein